MVAPLPSLPLPSSQPVVPGQAFRPIPPAARIPASGSGQFEVLPSDPRPDVDDVSMHYTVEIEDGLPFEPSAVARVVDATLGDPRGWTTELGATFARVDQDADLRVLVATPGTTDRLCAPLETQGRVSCRNGDLVVLNALRWSEATPEYANAVGEYRRYVVNHEVGHALGQAHAECPGAGDPAPVMQQQTYGLEGCSRNAWPTVA